MIDVTLKLSAVQAARSNKYVHGTVTEVHPGSWIAKPGAAVTRAYPGYWPELPHISDLTQHVCRRRSEQRHMSPAVHSDGRLCLLSAELETDTPIHDTSRCVGISMSVPYHSL